MSSPHTLGQTRAHIRLCNDFSSPERHRLRVPCPRTSRGHCPACAKGKQLEKRILQAKKDLEGLLEEHREIRSRMNHAHDPILHRLPPEIVSSIFQFCLPVVRPHDIFRITKEQRAAPLILGAVCRYWRKVAWSTPRLWSLIAIRVQAYTDLDNLLGIAGDWLGRSGKLPLTIGLSVFSSATIYPASRAHFRLADLVNQYSKRWEVLDIRIQGSQFSHFHRGWSQAPLLQTLRLSNIDGAATVGRPSDVSNSKSNPKQLYLDNVPFKYVGINWGTLRRLVVVDVTYRDFLSILAHSPQLTHTDIKRLRHPVDVRSDEIKHDRLTHLALNCGSLGTAFLRRVTLPSLEIFECRDQFPGTDIASMFRRSVSTLKKFYLNSPLVDQDSLVTVLQIVPSLQHLEICVTQDNAPSPDSFFRMLASTSLDVQTTGLDTPTFLPNLQYLAYHRPNAPTGFAWSLILDIFKSYSGSGQQHRRPLDHLILSFGSYESVPQAYLSRKSVSRFLALLKNIDLSVRFGEELNNSDFIRLSAIHHDIPYVTGEDYSRIS